MRFTFYGKSLKHDNKQILDDKIESNIYKIGSYNIDKV
jgi:hypothetical protein